MEQEDNPHKRCDTRVVYRAGTYNDKMGPSETMDFLEGCDISR